MWDLSLRTLHEPRTGTRVDIAGPSPDPPRWRVGLLETNQARRALVLPGPANQKRRVRNSRHQAARRYVGLPKAETNAVLNPVLLDPLTTIRRSCRTLRTHSLVDERFGCGYYPAGCVHNGIERAECACVRVRVCLWVCDLRHSLWSFGLWALDSVVARACSAAAGIGRRCPRRSRVCGFSSGSLGKGFHTVASVADRTFRGSSAHHN